MGDVCTVAHALRWSEVLVVLVVLFAEHAGRSSTAVALVCRMADNPDFEDKDENVNELIGIKESDTGLGPPSTWDLVGDKQRISEQPLSVARCTKIIPPESADDQAKYLINVKQIAKFVVSLGERVAPTDVEEACVL